ncbi:hypothetical protein DKM44_09990 [Deinococcus irradiatisoli]|uniref:DUF3298 domain-containing protein n=1 Tax=Deinococcus irradiatisoli TaxID=2202254 RepID=A0A2Z3JPF8_9DEIO|nr:hypothetical protein DKM44_09990 [Deinococcus irradiatisoli]
MIPGVYRGSLGTAAITLQVQRPTSGDDEVGAYFYGLHQTNLTLRGGHQGSALVLAESVWGGPERGLQTTGCFTLTPAGSALKGQWRSPQGQTQAVSLQLLNVGAQPLRLQNTSGVRKLREDKPLTFLKLNTAWVKVAGGVKEPLSGVVYPRVTGASAALSGALQDRQLQAAASALECRSQLGDTPVEPGEGFQFSAQLTRLTPRLVSLRENADYYCGGAHPDSFSEGLILDRQSGQPVAPGALWPGLSSAEQLRRYLTHYPKAAGRECLDAVTSGASDTEPAQRFTAWLTVQGLTLLPTYLPHVTAACAEPVTLTYAELHPLAKVGGPYWTGLEPR